MTRQRVELAAIAALAVLGAYLFVVFTPSLLRLIETNPLSDIRAYYDAGARLNAGMALYPVDADVNASNFYRYPPLLAIAFRPLALLPFQVAAAIWEGLLVVSLVATVRLAGLRPITVIALAGLSLPIAWSIALGQAQVLVTWLMAIASPATIALAGQLKILPVLVVTYFIGRRDWVWVRRFAVWSAGLIALQIVLEPRGSLDFLRIANLSQVGVIENLSPYGASPVVWAVLALLAGIMTLALARTRYGWAAAVWFATLVTPRLISYLIMAGLAALGRADGRERGSRESTHSGAPP